MGGFDEEQIDELRVLEAIYPNELTIISDKPPIKFEVFLKVNTESSENDHSVKLSFEIVPDYPHVGPLIEIEELSENFLESDRTELSELLEREVSNNLGMVMVFVILSNVNEWLQLKSESTEQRKIEEKERKKREAEAEEMKRFEGTRVTVESFMAWKRKFDVEMAELEKQKHRDEGGNKKLTGRELFEKDKTMIESDLKFLSEDITLETDEVVVDESLFQEIEDLDLDDLSDGERDCK